MSGRPDRAVPTAHDAPSATFQVDLRGVVDLLARHLYSSPRVYLRELLQNGVDAITARSGLDHDADDRTGRGTILLRPTPDGGLWTYEAKLDGYRCLAAKRGNRVVLWSRRGNGFTARFPGIVRACEKLPVKSTARLSQSVQTAESRSTPYKTAAPTLTFSFMSSTFSFTVGAV